MCGDRGRHRSEISLEIAISDTLGSPCRFVINRHTICGTSLCPSHLAVIQPRRGLRHDDESEQNFCGAVRPYGGGSMGARQAKEEPEEARRARDVGMTLADSMSLTGEELVELARREAMAPMKINCQTEQGEVMPCCACIRLPVFPFSVSS